MEQLQSVQKMTKKPIPELVALDQFKVDQTILYILDIFYDIKKSEKTTFQEMKCYCDLMHVELDPEEIDAIFAIERIYNQSLR